VGCVVYCCQLISRYSDTSRHPDKRTQWIERGEVNICERDGEEGDGSSRRLREVDIQSHPKITEQNPNCPSDLIQDKNFDFDMIFPLRTPSTSIPAYQLSVRSNQVGRKLTCYFDFSIIL